MLQENEYKGIDKEGLNFRAGTDALSEDELLQLVIKDYKITKEFWESING